jgi:glycosyltransferase involved in cell wall biosynthesis
MSEPLISVVIPVYNGEAFLDQAIESVLRQTWPRTEIVVVDDGSSDGSTAIAASYPVTLVRQRNRGVAAARNVGAERAKGALLTFLDQDDMFLPEKLERQLEALLEKPEAGISVCKMTPFLDPGQPLPRWIGPTLIETDHHSPQTGTMLTWRSAFEHVGPFSETYRMGNDTDWLLRALELDVPIVRLDDALLRYRIHERNESRRMDAVLDDSLKVFRAAVHRKRERLQDL